MKQQSGFDERQYASILARERDDLCRRTTKFVTVGLVSSAIILYAICTGDEALINTFSGETIVYGSAVIIGILGLMYSGIGMSGVRAEWSQNSIEQAKLDGTPIKRKHD